MIILLFDMDGVLLQAKAYHRALRETVKKVGKSLGYQNVDLRQEDIDLFEAIGVTSEWDSSAICAALMLRDVWSIHPNAVVPSELPLPELPPHQLKSPDFQAFFKSPEMSDATGEPGRDRARRLLIPDINGYIDTQVKNLLSLLDGSHNIHTSITHRIFQELVLGSDYLKEYYGLEPAFHVEGYLQTEDVPKLRDENRRKLLAWLEQPDHHGAVFTLRPSMPPEGFFDTPEAEIGLKVVELEGLPLVGHGGLAWYAEENDSDVGALIKPSPIHVLSAIRRSLGDPLVESIELSAEIALNGIVANGWRSLGGAQVYAFEDSIGGFRSAQNARDVLNEHGICIHLKLIGISDSSTKVKALEEGGATEVYQDLNEALEHLLNMD